ncbi:NUDIX hydrolase [Ciceribacter sp. L1K23]|nr:NUDIX hydrolase [Ciceribacter sp. L1K23]
MTTLRKRLIRTPATHNALFGGTDVTVGLRPRDAATVMVFDRAGGRLRVLVGKRSAANVFMPDFYVFPGGRRDRSDFRHPFASDAHPLVIGRLCNEGLSISRARALALAAVRELHEETGLWIGDANTGKADLSTLRYVARAITPPGNVRRFDTRFFCTFADETALDLTSLRDSEELSDLRWVDMDTISGLNMASITRTILEDVATLMHAEPSLPFGLGGPFYYERHGRFVRGTI